MCKGSLFSASSLRFVICRLFNEGHCDQIEVYLTVVLICSSLIINCVLVHSLSVMSNSFETPWTVAHQAPLSMEFPRQEHWSRLPSPYAADLPDPGIEPASPVSPALVGGVFTTTPPMMLSIFSCAYCPSVCFLRQMSIKVFCSFFLFLLLSCIGALICCII